MLSEPVMQLEMEAVRLEALSSSNPDELFHFVVSAPVACPSCDDPWVILLSQPKALEVQLGREGTKHLTLLTEAMMKSCATKDGSQHFRTDGNTVWQVNE